MTEKINRPRRGIIERIKLKNFRRFPEFAATLDPDLNLLVGDNEAGKSTILLALDIVLGGSRAKVATLGLERLFNRAAIATFLTSKRAIDELPVLWVEVYLAEQHDSKLNGNNNSEHRTCDGLCFVCEPNDEFTQDIRDILRQEEPNFPYEYYEPRFFTFSGEPYIAYNRPIRHMLLDSSEVNNDYATRAYVADLYSTTTEGAERHKYENEYRRQKGAFGKRVLGTLNERLQDYAFVLRSTGRDTLESDLTIADHDIPIEDKGKGQQSFIKTEFALKRSRQRTEIAALLLEEPENHLSHINMRRLIQKIREGGGKQVFVATHSNLIAARLDLRKCLLLSPQNSQVASLDRLTKETADFFMKAPDNNVLEFVLCDRVILVEGAAEYILMEAFFRNRTGLAMEQEGTHVISVGGTSFKRYLELAVLLGIRTAVIRDNDGDYQHNCVERYTEFVSESVRVFFERDNGKKTFEQCIYDANRSVCERVFQAARKTVSVEQHMLGNKTECALRLLDECGTELVPPGYFKEAIDWISE